MWDEPHCISLIKMHQLICIMALSQFGSPLYLDLRLIFHIDLSSTRLFLLKPFKVGIYEDTKKVLVKPVRSTDRNLTSRQKIVASQCNCHSDAHIYYSISAKPKQ